MNITNRLSIVVLTSAFWVGGCDQQSNKAEITSSSFTAEQNKEAIIAGFTKAAEQSNKRGPVMINQDTRWDRTEVGPGARLTYFYSFPSFSAKDAEPGWIEDNVKPDMVKSVCGSAEMKLSLESEASYMYAYSGNDGSEIARFEITKNDCQ